jgi:hypothetical protein
VLDERHQGEHGRGCGSWGSGISAEELMKWQHRGDVVWVVAEDLINYGWGRTSGTIVSTSGRSSKERHTGEEGDRQYIYRQHVYTLHTCGRDGSVVFLWA